MRKRTDVDRLLEMVRLHRMGVPNRKAAAMLNMGPNNHRAARDAFAAAGVWDGDPEDLPEPVALRALLPQGKPKQQISSVERWRATITLLEERGLNAKTIHDRLKLDHPDFKGTYDAVKRVVAGVREKRPLKAEDVVIPVETDPGQIAQVDFAYVGEVLDPASSTRRKAWVFVMTLGFSRHFFTHIVFDQMITTWLDLHVRAFRFFGGVPRVIVPDNLKAAVIRAAFGVDDDVVAQRDYRELARHHGFQIDPTPPRSPEKKGKVERNVQFVEGFLESRDRDLDVDGLNQDLDRWNREIASQRVHGTTKRVPIRVFEEEERQHLLGLPARPWIPKTWRRKTVQRDAHVPFERRYYSVPWQHIGQEVLLEATPDRIRIWLDGALVAEHDRHGEKLRSTADGHLPTERAAYAERNPAFWRKRAEGLGPETAAWVAEQLDGNVVSQLRVVQAAVTYLETLADGRAEPVCRRAREFGVKKLKELKNIVALGLDRKDPPPPPPEEPQMATFARPLTTLFQNRLGGGNVWN